MDNTVNTSNNEMVKAQTAKDQTSSQAVNAQTGGNTLNKDARTSKEYLEKYGLIQKITECEY